MTLFSPCQSQGSIDVVFMDSHSSGKVPVDGLSAGCRGVAVYVVLIVPSPAGKSKHTYK